MQAPALAALLVVALAFPLAQAADTPPTDWPPKGIKPNKTPQFLLFTHDDGVSSWNTGLVLPISNSARNPNGCKVPVTWFACTRSCDFDCGQVAGLYSMGHELAAHTKNHIDLRQQSKKKIKDEIVGSRADIAACGVPLQSIAGFRAPFLSDKPEVRQVLSDNGFRYDSTIGAASGSMRMWPGMMTKRVGFDCRVAGQQCSTSERYPGLWQVPLYEAPDHNLMDYCTDERLGKPRPNCSPLSQLQYMFDSTYKGNRGPVSVAIHAPYLTLNGGKYAKDLSKFFMGALKQKDVWAVTMSQLLDWMENPAPASEMPQFMAKYKCNK